ncbi:MAG: hypothetical protein H0V53_07730 [Rubrobacter sp.]|nr:hypothetical protein [Rubrobacter sp.]
MTPQNDELTDQQREYWRELLQSIRLTGFFGSVIMLVIWVVLGGSASLAVLLPAGFGAFALAAFAAVRSERRLEDGSSSPHSVRSPASLAIGSGVFAVASFSAVALANILY